MLLVCLLTLTAWSAASAHVRVFDAGASESLLAMADSGDERDLADDQLDDGEGQSQVDTHPVDDIALPSQAWPVLARYTPSWYAHHAPATQKRDLIPQLRPPNALRA
ncbi:hypothetical protein [Xanthomonas maliensis]|uniref:hypothetical protein n=1 Tax=Xanthomonas maliensis TaxID=1321368 RepID=UPI0004CE35F6|nr:hypothetical protein [Xanthomonas maliensis]